MRIIVAIGIGMVVGGSASLSAVQQQRGSPVASLPNDVQMEFVPIAPGEFMMGCSPGDGQCSHDEKPTHLVRITRGFEMGKYEVTEAQWQAVMVTSPFVSFSGDGTNHAVGFVGWASTADFLDRLKHGRMVTDIGFRPKRNGNTRHEPGLQGHTADQTPMRSAGLVRTSWLDRNWWGRNARTRGVYMTRRGMHGSGLRIGMTVRTTPAAQLTIRRVQPAASTAFCAAGPPSPTPDSPVCLFATSSEPPPALTTMVFVLCGKRSVSGSWVSRHEFGFDLSKEGFKSFLSIALAL
jgi:hypothetical protein